MVDEPSSIDTLEDLVNKAWKSGASHWGANELTAHRVRESSSPEILGVLKSHQGSLAQIPRPLCLLIEGCSFEEIKELRAHHLIIKAHETELLGCVWAALLPYLQPALPDDSNTDDRNKTPSPGAKRLRRPPILFGNFVPSATADLGGSSPGSSPPGTQAPATSALYGNQPWSPGSSFGALSSVDWVMASADPPREDVAVHLASCFINCVLHYAQPTDSNWKHLQFRGERISYAYASGGRVLNAIDDGGIDLIPRIRSRPVLRLALLEAKRGFGLVRNGRPAVRPEVLAQMTGESIALALQSRADDCAAFPADIITILATANYIKFFHFAISSEYLQSYGAIVSGNGGVLSHDLRVESTNWFDIKNSGHRRRIVLNLLALVNWGQTCSRA